MKLITYSGVNQASVEANLGKPEYSYFFVYDGFCRALSELGEVVTVDQPDEEVDRILETSEEDCIFLSFTPPHKAPVGLKCPTLCVFAWEFDTVPDESWDDNPKNDWRYVFRDHGRTITLASYSTRAVQRAMGDDYTVASIPVPVWESQASVRALLENSSPLKSGAIHFIGDLVDSDKFNFDSNSQKFGRGDAPEWDGVEFNLKFDFNSRDITQLNGFYAAEEWGSWSRAVTPTVELPTAVSGLVQVTLNGHGYHNNVARKITVTLGSSKTTVELLDYPASYTLDFNLLEPATRMSFRGLETTPPPGSADRRTLGIGLVSLAFSRPDNETIEKFDAENAQRNGEELINLKGIVYTSVFNPADGRKNWIDLVSAFCYAHRHRANVTLVLKMVTSDLNSFIGTLRLLLTQLAPFECRVVAIRAFLSDEQFQALMANTTYYVNASHCEGLCLPLMEYLAAGIPAVAPDITAMADYMNDDLGFVVRTSVEQNVWPHDPRDLFRALRYRINWESLRDAYEESYQVAVNDPDRYRQLARNARNKLESLTSVEVVAKRLRAFLDIPE